MRMCRSNLTSDVTQMSSSSVAGLTGRDSPDCAENSPPESMTHTAVRIFKHTILKHFLFTILSPSGMQKIRERECDDV